MILEPALWLFAIGTLSAIVVLRYRRRLKALSTAHRRLEKYADTLLQHIQGTILNVHGITIELGKEDPIRQRIEYALERADHRLSEIRVQMQPLYSDQQNSSL